MFINTVNLYFMGASTDAPARPLLQIENAEFLRGYQSGILAATHGESAGIPLTDADIVDTLRELYQEEGEALATIHFVVGSLFGRVIGKE